VIEERGAFPELRVIEKRHSPVLDGCGGVSLGPSLCNCQHRRRVNASMEKFSTGPVLHFHFMYPLPVRVIGAALLTRRKLHNLRTRKQKRTRTKDITRSRVEAPGAASTG